MKLRFAVVAIVFASLLVLANTNIAQAQWPAISSGYAVTTNWHGIDVPLGESVTATAGTTDPFIQTVEFKWIRPDGTVAFDETVGPLSSTIPSNVPPELTEYFENNKNSTTVYFAQNTQTLDILGDWGVQAIFHNQGTIHGKNSDIVRIRATSFNVVPEVPFGTIAILMSMFGTLSAFVLKKKRNRK